MLRFAALAVLATCHAPVVAPPVEHEPDPGPPVDEACLQSARDGRLTTDAPREAEGFAVTTTSKGLHLVRRGRDLTQAEGRALWELFTKDYFSRGGLATGHSALTSIYKCPDVGDASCMSFALWVCQTDVATLAGWVSDAARRVGAGDGELALDVEFLERRGPSCTKDCTPASHYSTPNARFEPQRPRHVLPGFGRGRAAGQGEHALQSSPQAGPMPNRARSIASCSEVSASS